MRRTSELDQYYKGLKTGVLALLCGFALSGYDDDNSIVSLSDADLSKVCRATVAANMGRDIGIIVTDKVEDSIAYVSYVRPNDGKLWKSRCRVEGDRLIWGTVDAFGPGSGFGRWRTHPEDERIQFAIEGLQVTIKQIYSDGSRSTNTFTVE